MNVLSLFDGMSCGQIALDKLGATITNYFASEIETNAIKVTQENYPNTIQLGDVTNWKEWDLPKIDLLMGGSPCQGFSTIGKTLHFEDERSKLLYYYVEILKHYKPKWFLLENVVMSQKCRDVISELLGVEPILINSALVSAQNRKRLYWTNIKFNIPEDKGITLDDVIDHSIQVPYIKSEDNYVDINRSLYVDPYNQNPIITNKSSTLRTNISNGNMWIRMSDGHYRNLTPEECERLQTVPIGYTASVGGGARKKMLGNGWTVDVIIEILKEINK